MSSTEQSPVRQQQQEEPLAKASLDSDEASSSTVSSAPPGASVAAKTPVSLLQELYVRRGITPKYDLVQIEGAVHEPTFKYRVTVGEFVATGCGQSKKKAKHSAAKAVLERIRHSQQKGLSNALARALQLQSEDESEQSSSQLPQLPELDKQVVVLSPYDDGIEGNPVGELQELCMNRRTQPPVYEVSLEEGQPHERRFVIVCSVGKQKEAGFGKSKKLAKRQAANKMLRRLKEQPAENADCGSGGIGGVDGGGSGAFVDDDELALGIVSAARGVLNAQPSIPGGTKQAQALRVANFYKNLKPLPGTQLQGLQELSGEQLKEDPSGRLDKICAEQDILVTYVQLEEVSKLGERMCLLQLSTAPVAVCFGTGEDEEAARKASSLNALQFLAVMTR